MDAMPYNPADRVVVDPYDPSTVLPVLVVDTDALLSSIDNHCRTGWNPYLLRMAKLRNAHTYAGVHVYGEVYRGFSRIAKTSPVPADKLRACFEEHYLPLIRWVKPHGDTAADARVAQVTDETDVPTAHLASLIAPCLVLSEDRALRRPGFAPEKWRIAAKHGTLIIEGRQTQQASAMAVVLPPYGAVAGGIKLGGLAQIPWWGTLLLMGASGYLLLQAPERRQAVGAAVGKFLEVTAEVRTKGLCKEQEGTLHLEGVLFRPMAPPSPKQQVTTVLARALTPMLATEIHQTIASCYVGGALPSVTVVRAILKDGPEFTQPERSRWQLGYVSDPWRSKVVFGEGPA